MSGSKQVDEIQWKAQCSRARIDFAKKLRKWGICRKLSLAGIDDDEAYAYMAGLFGFTSSRDMIVNFTEEHKRKLEILNGPHGYALLKVMEANKEVT